MDTDGWNGYRWIDGWMDEQWSYIDTEMRGRYYKHKGTYCSKDPGTHEESEGEQG